MTLYDYLMLDEHEQAIALSERGRCVATFDDGRSEFFLYSLSVFFVELERDRARKK